VLWRHRLPGVLKPNVSVETRFVSRRLGFEVVDIAVNYYQSHYYSFCAPLYIFSALYEMIVQTILLENLAARGDDCREGAVDAVAVCGGTGARGVAGPSAW
jgi:hypothetical protein